MLTGTHYLKNTQPNEAIIPASRALTMLIIRGPENTQTSNNHPPNKDQRLILFRINVIFIYRRNGFINGYVASCIYTSIAFIIYCRYDLTFTLGYTRSKTHIMQWTVKIN